MRITVRVKPGSSRPAVGGSYEAPDGPQLVVAVTVRAVDGKATAATLRAVADAFGVHRRAVTLVSGERSRTKILDVASADPHRLATLLAGP